MGKTIFGTDGIRNKVGQSPLTHDEITKLGKCIALWAQKKYGDTPQIIIGHDTRISCALFKASLKTGLLLFPVKIYDTNIIPTPAIFNIIRNTKQFDVGIIISASHNPYYDNGIKITNSKTTKLSAEDEEEISDLFFNLNEKDSYASLGTSKPFPTAKKQYEDDVTSRFEKKFLHGTKVVIDCAHGATSDIAPEIFKKLGAEIIAIDNTPNGININENCGSTYPENLKRAVLEKKGDLGFAFDGDGDRIIAVNKYGDIKDGDDILCLLTHHPAYSHEKNIVGTILTNQGLETYLQGQNKKLVRAKVGDKHVVAELQKDNLPIGGEQSGHIIMRDYLDTGDGIFSALRILETIKLTDNWEMKTFDKYPQVMINIPVTEKKDLSSEPLSSIINNTKSSLKNGRLIVRYSGTENLLRVMVEEESYDFSHKICTRLSKNLQKEL